MWEEAGGRSRNPQAWGERADLTLEGHSLDSNPHLDNFAAHVLNRSSRFAHLKSANTRAAIPSGHCGRWLSIISHTV